MIEYPNSGHQEGVYAKSVTNQTWYLDVVQVGGWGVKHLDTLRDFISCPAGIVSKVLVECLF